MDFLSNDLSLILCGLAGFALLVTEAFMPGIGVAGVLGVILEIFAVYLAWVRYGATVALILTVIIIAVIALTVFLSYRSALRGRLSKTALVLKDTEAPGQEPAAKSLLAYRDREGVAVSALRPGGTIEVDGVQINAASGGGELVQKGSRVRILGAEGDHVIVRPI